MQLIVKAIQNLLASKLKSKRNVSLLHFHNKLIDKQSIILLSILPHLTISITKLSESYFILLIHLLCHFSPYLLIIRSISRHMLPLPVSNQLSPLSPPLPYHSPPLTANKLMNSAWSLSLSLLSIINIIRSIFSSSSQTLFVHWNQIRKEKKKGRGVKKEKDRERERDEDDDKCPNGQSTKLSKLIIIFRTFHLPDICPTTFDAD